MAAIISLIAAVSANSVIGKKGVKELLWHLPDDFKYFKNLTTGKPIIMGRTTYETIGKPLPNRTNIVLTKRADYKVDGVTVVHTVDEALAAANQSNPEEIMIIGGAQIYQLFLPLTKRIYLTDIDTKVDGDIYFPEFDRSKWHETSSEKHAIDDRHAYSFRFITLERNH